ncbi:hypothetical protein F5Y04DRAFT_269928 [Hypomontagnella monticulosa]|nr:hypothetical protein F5Y04DRAFT_269928 [Hypomontagnella monticulosa]
MHSQNILTRLLPLFSLGLALPLEARDATDFNITSLSATFPYPGVYGVDSVNSFVEIALSYPDPASSDASLTTTCRVDWPAGTPPAATAWAACADPDVVFRIASLTSTNNFSVGVFQQRSVDGEGLSATHVLTSNPGNPSDPNAYMFCLQKGKFNPLTCSLTGPYGSTPRIVEMTSVAVAERPA